VADDRTKTAGVTYPTQLAAEALAAHDSRPWSTLTPRDKRAYLDAAVAACEAIVASEEGWQIVRVADLWAGDNGGHCILADEVWQP
jgi:hypothetical protein